MRDRMTVIKSGDVRIIPTNQDDIWQCDWDVRLKKSDVRIGKASFAGEKVYGTVPFYFEIEPEYREKGYGTKVCKMLTNWLFHFTNIFEVEGKVQHENDFAIKTLNASDFVLRYTDKDVDTYSIKKEKTVWTGFYVIVGMILGLAGGFFFGNILLGFVAGVVLSFIVGSGMDLRERKYRESVTGKKDTIERNYRKKIKEAPTEEESTENE